MGQLYHTPSPWESESITEVEARLQKQEEVYFYSRTASAGKDRPVTHMNSQWLWPNLHGPHKIKSGKIAIPSHQYSRNYWPLIATRWVIVHSPFSLGMQPLRGCVCLCRWSYVCALRASTNGTWWVRKRKSPMKWEENDSRAKRGIGAKKM